MSEHLSRARDGGSDGSVVSARSRLSDIPDTEDNALPERPPPHMEVQTEGEHLCINQSHQDHMHLPIITAPQSSPAPVCHL